MARFISPITDIKPSGSLRFFKSGTNTELITYKDEGETPGLENPTIVPVLANGNVQNVFYSGSAKVLYLDEFDVQYAERDPVGGEKELGDFTLWDTTVTYDLNDIVEGSDGKFYISLSNSNQGNDPTTTPTQWSEIRFLGVWNTNVTYSVGDVVQTTDGNLWRALTSGAGNDPLTNDGTNWVEAFSNPWINKSAAFNILAGKKYQIDASGGAVDAPLSTAYVAGDVITVHNESISTNTVRLTNTALTLKGTGDTITTSDNLVLAPGDTAHIAMKTTTIGEFV